MRMKYGIKIMTSVGILLATGVVASMAPATPKIPPAKYPDRPIGYLNDYLIVAPDEFATPARRLKTYRETFGHRVKIVLLSEIGRAPVTSEQIDAWIERHQRSNRNLKYVALLGDAARLPPWSRRFDRYEVTVKSDLPYGVTGPVTETNHIPDVMVGRVSLRTAAEFDSYLAKIRLFDQTFKLRRKIVFFGFHPEIDYAINRDIGVARSLGYETQLLVYPPDDEFFRAVNNPDVAAVFYYSHGSWYGNVPLTQANINALKNYQTPFLYFSGGCGFGDGPLDQRSLSEVLLLGASGSAASIGASLNGGYGSEYTFVPGALGTLRSSQTLGELFLAGLRTQRASALSLDSPAAEPGPAFSLYFTYRMSLVGDPALRLR